MLKGMIDTHQAAAAQYDKLAKARSLMDATRQELDALSKLGDLVSSEDVIKGAGNLVAKGMSPLDLAKLLSDMPEHGPQLQVWLQNHAVALAQQEQLLQPMLDGMRYHMVTTGLQVLAGHHFGMPMGRPQAAGPQNALAPSGPAPAPAQPSLTPDQPVMGNA